MAGNFESDLKQSSDCFNKLIAPKLHEIFSPCEIFSIENQSSDLAKILDNHCGIDSLIKNNRNSLVYGIASRIQFTNKSYGTFTIRDKRDNNTLTEFGKRQFALKNGGIYPYYTLQAYVTEKHHLLNMAIMKTADLFNYIEKYPNEVTEKHTQNNKIGQASFKVCKWQNISQKGFSIHILNGQQINLFSSDNNQLAKE